MSSNNNKCDGLLQTLSVITLIISMIFLMFGCLFLFAMCFSLYTCWIPILYLIWFIYDFNITEKVIFELNYALNFYLISFF